MTVEGSKSKHFGNNPSTYVIECQEMDSLFDQFILAATKTNNLMSSFFFLRKKMFSVDV